MDFSITEKQKTFQQEVLKFARTELNDDIISRDRNSKFSYELWKKCADFGLLALSVPEKYGGKSDSYDLFTAVLGMESLGYGCRDNGLTFAVNAQLWTVQLPILLFGTDEQKKRFLPGMISGKLIGAHALTEPDFGSDIFNMAMTATRKDNGYILNGKKCMVSFAPIADLILVFANANPKRGKWGVTAFLVEKGIDGLTTSPNQEKMGLRTVPFGDIEFNNCFVSEDYRLGPEGGGLSLSQHSLEYERCYILASHLGAMERQLDEAIAYVKKRKQFGQSIGKFQSVSNRIAEMKLRLETSRLLLYKVAYLKQTGQDAMMESALLKLHLSESFMNSSLDAIRSFGGSGYITGTGVERDLRDAIGGVLYAGTSDIQRNIVAKLLGL